jgi:hypothetical protein
MKPWFDPRYCPQCYQFPGDVDYESVPEACRACSGRDNRGTETVFEAAFIFFEDIDGGPRGGGRQARVDTQTNGPRTLCVGEEVEVSER